MREQLTKAKGMGNFRNLFYYAHGGKKEGIQLVPTSEVAAKKNFLNIKNASRDDVLAVHLVPPQLMGMLPNNVGGFGDVEKAAKVFARNRSRPCSPPWSLPSTPEPACRPARSSSTYWKTHPRSPVQPPPYK
ncbi:hypothetical protein [Diaphorobacter sp.]|uniref:hypothetical protein n=1 Tax=Diaphorobacter sp. TaxID=1934310 RepID=UPI00338FADC6